MIGFVSLLTTSTPVSPLVHALHHFTKYVVPRRNCYIDGRPNPVIFDEPGIRIMKCKSILP
jgi:hypothetical protein